MLKHILLLSLMTSIVSCNYRIDKLKNKSSEDTNNKADAIATFSSVKSRILQSQCLRCHDGTKKGRNLSDYANTITNSKTGKPNIIPGKPDESILYLSLLSDANRPMPPDGSLSAGDIEYVRQWILSGAPETADDVAEQPKPEPDPVVVTPTPEPEPTPVPLPSLTTFQEVKDALLGPRCIKCHSDEMDTREALLAAVNEDNRKWIEVIGNADGNLIVEEIAEGRMPPPKKKNPATQEEIDLLKKWINEGAN